MKFTTIALLVLAACAPPVDPTPPFDGDAGQSIGSDAAKSQARFAVYGVTACRAAEWLVESGQVLAPCVDAVGCDCGGACREWADGSTLVGAVCVGDGEL